MNFRRRPFNQKEFIPSFLAPKDFFFDPANRVVDGSPNNSSSILSDEPEDEEVEVGGLRFFGPWRSVEVGSIALRFFEPCGPDVAFGGCAPHGARPRRATARSATTFMVLLRSTASTMHGYNGDRLSQNGYGYNIYIYIYETCAWTPNNFFLLRTVVGSLSTKLECWRI